MRNHELTTRVNSECYYERAAQTRLQFQVKIHRQLHNSGPSHRGCCWFIAFNTNRKGCSFWHWKIHAPPAPDSGWVIGIISMQGHRSNTLRLRTLKVRPRDNPSPCPFPARQGAVIYKAEAPYAVTFRFPGVTHIWKKRGANSPVLFSGTANPWWEDFFPFPGFATLRGAQLEFRKGWNIERFWFSVLLLFNWFLENFRVFGAKLYKRVKNYCFCYL